MKSLVALMFVGVIGIGWLAKVLYPLHPWLTVWALLIALGVVMAGTVELFERIEKEGRKNEDR